MILIEWAVYRTFKKLNCELCEKVTHIHQTSKVEILFELLRAGGWSIASEFQENFEKMSIDVEIKSLSDSVSKKYLWNHDIRKVNVAIEIKFESWKLRSNRCLKHIKPQYVEVKLPSDLVASLLFISFISSSDALIIDKKNFWVLSIVRSKFCLRCDGDGHIARTCTEDPKCLLCRNELNAGITNQTSGSYRCPANQKKFAIQKTWLVWFNSILITAKWSRIS